MAMCLLLMAIGGASCGKSAEEKAEQARRDSIDSVHRADSVYEAQTREMQALDTFIDRRMDSIRSPQKYAPDADIDKDANAFVDQAMHKYINALNSATNVSTAIGGDVSNKVLARLTDINGGPSKITDEAGHRIRYSLVKVKEEANHWFTVSWKRADEVVTVRLKVAMNGPKKLRIDEIE